MNHFCNNSTKLSAIIRYRIWNKNMFFFLLCFFIKYEIVKYWSKWYPFNRNEHISINIKLHELTNKTCMIINKNLQYLPFKQTYYDKMSLACSSDSFLLRTLNSFLYRTLKKLIFILWHDTSTYIYNINLYIYLFRNNI